MGLGLTEETGRKILEELTAIRGLFERTVTTTPTTLEKAEHKCPDCEGPMKLRINRQDPTSKFFGCTDFPSCRGVRGINGEDTRRSSKPVSDGYRPIPRQTPTPPAPRGNPGWSPNDYEDDAF